MNQLATRELTLFSLGAVAVVLMLTTLARAAQPAEEKSTRRCCDRGWHARGS